MKKCFVIMPFGKKENHDGKAVDFDKVYALLIKDVVQALGISCIRCDEIPGAGWIHSKMFKHIYDAEVAVVDITTLNPNVFYELGVRHTLKQSVTVLIRREGTSVPFNIQGFHVVDYGPEDYIPKKKVGAKPTQDGARKKIAEFIKHGLVHPNNDSPVHEVLELRINTQAKLLPGTEVFEYQPDIAKSKRIGLITGDIRHVKNVDVWVNSENTNMQMARNYDHSISGVIRYHGAKKDDAGHVIDDTIANELARMMGQRTHVPQGHVISTPAGDLAGTHNVKRVFHAAAVHGQVGKGYAPIPQVGQCVTAALEKFEAEAAGLPWKSILFPLVGTGTGHGEVEKIAAELIGSALSFLQVQPKAKIRKVYFLASTAPQLQACQRILLSAGKQVKPA